MKKLALIIALTIVSLSSVHANNNADNADSVKQVTALELRKELNKAAISYLNSKGETPTKKAVYYVVSAAQKYEFNLSLTYSAKSALEIIKDATVKDNIIAGL